jgi:ribonuclease HII
MKTKTGQEQWHFEHRAMAEGYATIAGVDEVGRGPLAGPVVAAAVVLPKQFEGGRITDSKRLTPRQRAQLYPHVYNHALGIGIGIVDALEIDRRNILQAALTSMAMAVANLHPSPDYLLIDGKFTIDSLVAQQAIIKGDSRSISIAAASIVAKVTRDRMMACYDLQYPQYGFARHKGYPTQAHRQALSRHGCCPIHRRSFRGVTP